MSWRRFLRRKHWDRERAQELQSYLEIETQENVARGMPLDAARDAACRRLGNANLVREEIYRMNSVGSLVTLLRNVRFALRLLAKNPGFTALAELSLALGIGPNTAIFSVVYGIFLAPMPYPHPNQLVVLWSKTQGQRRTVSPADFLDWRRNATCFQEMAAWRSEDYNLSSTQEPQYVPGERVTPNWYSMLGEKPWLGRDFRPDEDQPGKDHVFLISHKAWISRFGADPNIVGKQFRLNGEFYTAIGVMPPGTTDRHDEEIWTPLAFTPDEINRSSRWLLVMGRLKPGISLDQAQQQMNAVTAHLAELYPDADANFSATVEELRNDFLSHNTQKNLWVLLGAVSFVLLIACADVANMVLARGAGRQRELAVRAALGASSRQLIGQLFTESIALSTLGGIIGIALSWLLLKPILLLVPPGTLTSEAEVGLSIPVLLFTLFTTVFCGVVSGCAPALQARNVDLNETLKQGGRSAVGAGRRMLRQAFVVIEFALALTLLAGAALTVHSFLNQTRVDLGIRTDHVLTTYLPVPDGQLTTPQQIANFYSQLLTRVEATPGVISATADTGRPLDGSFFAASFLLPGQPYVKPSSRPVARFDSATPGYFETYGVRIERGRAFSSHDTAATQRVAVVNRTFARKYFAHSDPLSGSLRTEEIRPGAVGSGPIVEWRIIGVAHDVEYGGRPNDPEWPQIYVPFDQSPWPRTFLAVRTAMPPAQMTPSIAAAVHAVDANLPLAFVETMDQLAKDRFVDDRFFIALYGSFAAIALLLAMLGIYGVTSFTVAQATPEIGLRMALGASAAHVLTRVLKQGIAMAGAGLIIGFAGAFFMGRMLQSMLYGTGAVDWPAFSAVAALLLASALLACYVPARRASAVDPIVALRHE